MNCIKKEVNLGTQKCNICNSEDLYLYCKKKGYRIFRCRSCGCGFLDLSEVCFEASAFYQSYYEGGNKDIGYDDYFALERALKSTFLRRINTVSRYLNNKADKKLLLDIGCGPGFFLEVASRKFDVCGVEISGHAARYAKDKLHLNVINSHFHSGIFKDKKFDVVTLWDTIEHIDNADKLLTDVSAIMQSDGLLAFTTGDFDSAIANIFGNKWHLLNLPEHLFFFTRESIAYLLKKHGFDIVHLSYPYSYYTLGYLLERIENTLDMPTKGRLLVYRNILKKIIIPFNLFDIMLVVAKKRRINFSDEDSMLKI